MLVISYRTLEYPLSHWRVLHRSQSVTAEGNFQIQTSSSEDPQAKFKGHPIRIDIALKRIEVCILGACILAFSSCNPQSTRTNQPRSL